MSSDERPVIIKPTMDATGVRAGAEQVEQATRKMAQTVAAEGRKGGEGFDAIGEGAQRSAKQVEAESRRMAVSIQRASALLEAGGERNSKFFASVAAQRGLNADLLNPLIANYERLERAQIAASGSLGKIGVSAGQTANALRQVPAQFTDIVTSLQAGQAPLQVFLQQGGQLKDSFGGAGAAAQALGGYVLGLITPFTVLAAAVGTVAVGYALGSKEAQEYQRALVLSGNAVSVTADQLADLSRSIAAVGPITQGKAAEVLTQLAAAGAVGATNLGRFAEAAINLERVGGPAAEETAKAFAQLAKEPLQASIRLTESTRFLTAATAEQIAELERQGKTTEAARVAQEAYASTIEGRIPGLAARLGLLEKAWLGVKDATKLAADQVLNIGRPETLNQQIAAVNASISSAQRLQGQDGGGLLGRLAGRFEAEATARRDLLQEQVTLSQRAAAAEGDRQRQEKAGIEFLKEGEKLLSSQAKFAIEVARARELGRAAGLSEVAIAERLVALSQQAYGGKGGNDEQTQQRERERALEQQRNLLNELSGLTTSYAGDIQKLNAARAAGLVSEERYGELVRELVARQPFRKAAADEQAKALKAETDATNKAASAREQYLKTLDRDVETGERTLEQLRAEYIALTAGKEAVRERVALRIEEQIVALELQATEDEARRGDFAAAEALRERIRQLRVELQLRQGLGSAQSQQEERQNAERASQQAVKEWERASDQIGQSLTDALMQGGKNAGEYLASYFRTLVLRPIVEAVARPLVGALGSALGTNAFAGPGGAGGGGSGGLGLGGFGSFGAAGSAFSAGAQISINAGLAGTGTALQGSGALIAGGEVGAGLAQGAGALAPYLAAYTIGKFAGQKLSGGYAVGGGSGNSAINIGAAIGTIWGPIGTAIGAAVGGLVNRAFGRKLVDSGIEGTFAGGGFSGNAFQSQKGGFFRSDKTTTSALDAGVSDLLSAGAQATAQQARIYAELLGLPADAIAGYSRSIKVSLKDLSAEQIGKAIEGEIAAFGEGLAGQFNAQLAPFVKAGEKLSETFTRLAGLQAFSVSLNSLGGVFSRLAALSVGARESLLEMAGGPDALAGLSQSFAQSYYGRDEIAALKARDLQGAFAAAGVTNAPNSREQFRALVEGVDVSSAGGQKQLIDLLKLGGDFATVADYLTETGKTLSGAAASAPLSTQLASLFSQPQQQQVDAINNVAVGVGAVEAAVDRLTEVVRRGGYRGQEEPMWLIEP